MNMPVGVRIDRAMTIVRDPTMKSDVPNFVRYHAPAIRAHLSKWNEDIEADDFLRGRTLADGGWVFQCVKFPKASGFISDMEIENTPKEHHFLLVWRGWSDLFTNIHADCVHTEVQSEIKLRFRELWKEMFPDSTPLPPSMPSPDKIPRGLGFQFRDDWCHHCEMTTVHSNSEHDPWTFHCTNQEAHAARPRFEN